MVLNDCEQWSFMAEEEYELTTTTSAVSRHEGGMISYHRFGEYNFLHFLEFVYPSGIWYPPTILYDVKSGLTIRRNYKYYDLLSKISESKKDVVRNLKLFFHMELLLS